jgi:Protein of unknown function (DUF1553)/Protein of unknown function (DUF1549)
MVSGSIFLQAAAPPVDDKARAYWAFQPVTRPELPPVQDRTWVRNPIDAFILHQLEGKRLSPAGPADKTALLRRAYFDLTGLPPTPAEVERFLADTSPDAFRRVVDELLASPHYGECWGRHWLDCVRYAESNSFERDAAKPSVWRYRDYVIDAFNQDKPYDRFVLEQLAGDELDRVTPETVIATGYYRLGIWDDEPTDRLQARYDELDDVLATTGQVFLGLTVNCARCHDHKLDPIPQADYYRLLAFFHNIRPTEGDQDSILTDIPTTEEQAARRELSRAREEKIQAAAIPVKTFESRILRVAQGEGSIEETDPKRRAKLLANFTDLVLVSDEVKAYKKARQQLENLEKAPLPPFPRALSVKETGRTAPETFILVRGSSHNRGEKVEPGFPSVLGFPQPTIPAPGPDATTCGRRRVLAEWIASPKNPLTARVMVNRIWQHHFGRGIVASPNNFGEAGEQPTHPQLLDWLAAEFMERGWSVKAMHRLILTSSAYQMSSRARGRGEEIDPENHLFWRMNMRRLTAEEIRDGILAVNGSLNPDLGGPSIYPELSREVLATQSQPGNGWGHSSESEQARRSVYIHVKRSLIVPMMAAFDVADADSTCPVRFATTQPTQALTLLNSRFSQEEADRFARRLTREAGPEPSRQVELGLKLALSRAPTRPEIERGLRLMETLERQDHLDERAALARFCLVVFNLNEFVFLD